MPGDQLNMNIVIAHSDMLVRKALVTLISSFDFKVTNDVATLSELHDKIKTTKRVPSICIIDVDTPWMKNIELLEYMHQRWPQMRILVLTNIKGKHTINTMINIGVNGYLPLSCKPEELKKALTRIDKKGYYYSELAPEELFEEIRAGEKQVVRLRNKHIRFLELCCSKMTYQDMAKLMELSPRTIDNYRDDLLFYFNLNNRSELCLFAFQNGVFRL